MDHTVLLANNTMPAFQISVCGGNDQSLRLLYTKWN